MLNLDSLKEGSAAARPQLKSLNVSKNHSFDFNDSLSNGDHLLHKRILFLKETLELDPHLEENKKMLIKHFNEPKIVTESEDDMSPNNRTQNNKSVSLNNGEKLNMVNLNLKVSDSSKNKKMERRFSRKTRSLIRKQFDNEQSDQSPKGQVSVENSERSNYKLPTSYFEKSSN